MFVVKYENPLLSRASTKILHLNMARIQKKGLVVTSNDLLEAKYDFTLWQKRIFIYMVSRIGKEDKDFAMQRIYISELLRFFGSRGGKDYDVIRRLPRDMFEKEVRVPYFTDSGHKRWYVKRIITEYTEPGDTAEENNYIEMRFHSDLKPYLLDLSNRFSKYDIRNVLELGSVYSFRMFEILKSRHEIQRSYQPDLDTSIIEFDLDELKSILSVEEKYKLYADFKRFTLDRAQRDLEQYCDIVFTLKEVKQGKRVKSLQFVVRDQVPAWKIPSTGAATLSAEIPLFNESAINVAPGLFLQFEDLVVRSWGVPVASFQNICAQYAEEAIVRAVNLTHTAVKAGKVKNSPGGFFLKALESGWKSAQQIREDRAQEARAAAEAQRSVLQNQLEQLEVERRSAANDIIRGLTNEDPFLAGEAINKILNNPPLRESLEKDTALSLGTHLDMNIWRKSQPLKNAVIRQIELMHPEAFKAVKMRFDGTIQKLKKALEGLG